jgi:hypothetical protein
MRHKFAKPVKAWKECKECGEDIVGIKDYAIRDKHNVCGGYPKLSYEKRAENDR